jgi:hypothetical protein
MLTCREGAARIHVKGAVDSLCSLFLSFVLFPGIREAEGPLPLNISGDWACGFSGGALGRGLDESIRK